MSVSILEALENAEINLARGTMPLQQEIGRRQLHNAIVLLGKGYDPSIQVEPLLERYDDVEHVPENTASA
jgi:hypothetical protein